MTDPSPTTLWLLILGTAAATMAIKAFGPVVLGGRQLPPAATRVLVLLPPVVLAALVATSALADGSTLEIDSSTAGVAAAGVLFVQGRHLLLAVLVAAAVTAVLRLLGLP
ncbi:MAG: AzlD domain-containing protein [Nocardioides sp.]|uniref:AzlD domain-containing protein n=1 Tax=Nocardioides sp. TaxID=35761 RepID=UPI0023992A25|nr:AzlD domain-containing protein [Nocardioides sp.]MDE0774940.1 AzlD domain-containing protein [Nocardioides sp.]